MKMEERMDCFRIIPIDGSENSIKKSGLQRPDFQ